MGVDTIKLDKFVPCGLFIDRQKSSLYLMIKPLDRQMDGKSFEIK